MTATAAVNILNFQLVSQMVAMFKGLTKINWSLKWSLVIQLVAQVVAQGVAQPVVRFKGDPPQQAMTVRRACPARQSCHETGF